MNKKTVIFIISCSFIFGTFFAGAYALSREVNTMAEDFLSFKEKFTRYQSIVEETLVWREKSVEFISSVQDKTVLTNKNLTDIHRKGTNVYKKIRGKLLSIAKEYEWIGRSGTTVRLTENKSRFTDDNKWWNPFDNKNVIAEINPNDSTGQQVIKEAKMSLASALLLYDNYIVAVGGFQKIRKLRRIINSDNVDTQDYLEEVNFSYIDTDNLKRTARALDLIKREIAWEKQNPLSKLALDEDNRYLNQLIRGSLTYSRIEDVSFLTIQSERIKTYSKKIGDTVHSITGTASSLVSTFFGNGMGLIASRRGKLDDLSVREQDIIAASIQPLDILLEKTPFRLTDTFIPGHWGHVAIWTGTETELQELEVWQKLPEIYEHAVTAYDYDGPTFQKMVRAGNYIIEALRTGVEINTLDHFLNIDDFAVLRHKYLSKKEQHDFLVHAFEQIGKDYDFNFDVETDSKIVCSELAYVVYNEPSYNWPTEKALGRYTISPDQIANKATARNPFYPVLLYHDGKQIKNSLQEKFNQLLN